MNTKKRYLQIVPLLSIVFFLLNGCSNSINHTSTEIDLSRYVDIKEYIVRCAHYDDHQVYIEVVISNSDKRTLLQNLKFEDNLSKLKGRLEPTFITENTDYVYFVKEDGEGPYGYVLYALEKKGNTLTIFEVYGG